MADVNISELVATTLRNRSKKFADNVSNGNALLNKLNQKAKMPADGGRTIVQELEYAENSTFMYYSGYETLNIQPSTVFDAAEYNWKQAAVTVSVSGLEVNVQTTGKEAIINLLDRRISNAMKTFSNNLSTGIYSDGTGSGSKQITGLLAQVAKTPTSGTVGGINRATWEFWRNQSVQDSTYTSSTIEAKMMSLYIACTRGADHPDLIVADALAYQAYWGALTSIQRITRDDKANRGWASLAFLGADVTLDNDGGIGNYLMYFLNTDYIYWRPHSKINMTPLDRRNSLAQDADVIPIVWAGNLTMSNASLQGVLYKS